MVEASGNFNSIEWFNGSSSVDQEFFSSGTYWAEAELQGCFISDSINIIVQEIPQAEVETEYFLCSSNDSVVVNPVFSLTVDDEGIYEVQVVLGECEIEDEIIVVEIENPDVLIEDQTICPSDSFSFSTPVQNDGAWLNGSQIGSQFTVNSPADYELTLQIEQCQFSSGFSVEHLSDTLSLKSQYSLCEEDTLILTVQPENNPLWSGNVTTPEYAITQPGNYTVDFEMFGCEFSKEIHVVENLLCPCDVPVFIPNAFSADNDGINDHFRPEIYCALADYHLRIYNRWGQIVFESTDPDLTWNGSHNQGEYYVENEVYHYVLKIRGLIAVDDEAYKGHITVFR